MLKIGGLAAGGSIFGGLLGAGASKKAADVQAKAATHSADLGYQASKDALSFQREQSYKDDVNAAPFIQAGQGAISRLSDLMGPGGELTKPFEFDSANFQGDPGYAFRLSQGQKALESSAAARGTSLGGGALKATARYNQDYASNEYSNAYNRSFNTFQANQGNLFNRLAAISGAGQTAVAQTGSLNQAAAQNSGQIGLQGAQIAGNAGIGAANAQASGYIGGANALAGGIGGATNSIMSLALLSKLFGPGAGGGGFPTPANYRVDYGG